MKGHPRPHEAVLPRGGLASSQHLVSPSPPAAFRTGNCRKELEATLANSSPMILLHETDPARGGVPLEQLRNDCSAKHRTKVFKSDRPWSCAALRRLVPCRRSFMKIPDTD